MNICLRYLLTCGLLGLHDGSDVLLVSRLLGASLGVLVLLWGVLDMPEHVKEQYYSTYHVAQLLLGCLTGVLTLVTTGHLGLKGSFGNWLRKTFYDPDGGNS